MTTPEDIGKRATLQTDFSVVRYSTRNGRVSETLKDCFVTELRDFFNTKSRERLDAVPSVEKFSADSPGNNRELDPMETVVRVLRQFPDITQKLPFIGVTASSIKNLKLGMSTKLVDQIPGKPYLMSGTGSFQSTHLADTTTPVDGADSSVVGGTTPTPQWNDLGQPTEPFAATPPIGDQTIMLSEGDFVEFTLIIDGRTHVSRCVFYARYMGLAPQTLRAVANVINLQSLYCKASVIYKGSIPILAVEPGGPLGTGKVFSIQRTNASPNFDICINFDTIAHLGPSDEFPAVNRYAMSYTADVSLVIATDSDTIRTELTDLVMNFFTFLMDDRQFTFYGRSFFGDTEGESYQIIIKDSDIGCGGEAETPRGDDPVRKIYSNSISVPVHILYYIDRSAAEGIRGVYDGGLPMLGLL